MTVNELVFTVTTNSACLYEIRCPNYIVDYMCEWVKYANTIQAV